MHLYKVEIEWPTERETKLLLAHVNSVEQCREKVSARYPGCNFLMIARLSRPCLLRTEWVSGGNP